MSRRGNCWDNAVAESFFSSLKKEQIKRRIYNNREEACSGIFEYIEVFYNRRRRHSHLGPEYKVFDQVTVYALASYGVFESSVSQEEGSLSDSTDEFGYGVGTLINVFGDASLNLSYEKYDDVDSVALGFEYRF